GLIKLQSPLPGHTLLKKMLAACCPESVFFASGQERDTGRCVGIQTAAQNGIWQGRRERGD
ncbi:MAG TPA: hypothetical protein PK312_18580, partial [Nitrospira sp.]|nr:hypothetical protein [Nitrospira sp.]